MRKINANKGITILEFTLTSSFLMLVLLSIISIGMFMFSMQAVNESVRTAARMAAVCEIHDSAIKTYVADNSLVSMVGVDEIIIEYLGEDSQVLPSPISVEDVWFVRASATGLSYQFISLLDFLGENGLITIPSFETTIPSESLGISSEC